MAGGELDRRDLLRLAGLGLLLAGCSAPQDATPPAAAATPVPVSPPAMSPVPVPSPSTAAPVSRYVPLAGEPLPNLKRVAAGFLERLTASADGGAAAAVTRALPLTGDGFDAGRAAAAAGPLFSDAAVYGDVVYPQLGGLAPLGPGAQTASIMAVLRHRLTAPGGAQRDEVRVCDVRLAVQAGRWRVVDLVSVGGQPVDRPGDLDPRARAVLDDQRIELPDSARWDIHSGLIAVDLLDVVAQAARTAPISVTTLLSGHPANVFGTDKPSDHSQGRAVDLWRVGGQAVVDTMTARSLTGTLQRAAFADPRVSQIGSPIGSDLDGPGRKRSFVNLVHVDHLHLAVRSQVLPRGAGG